MSYTSNLKKMVDLPVWELLNQAPITNTAISAMTTVEDGSHKFIYYVVGSAFYRYDVEGDVWQQLASPNIAPSGLANLRVTMNRGFHGRVVSATSSTVRIPSLLGKKFDGKKIRILQGTGVGQERTLTHVSDTTHDFGVITAATTSALTDSTKKWKINQWAGYMVGITFGTDATQYKKVLANDATNLYFYDANLMPQDPWNNQPFQANTPYALPVTTAGAQSHYTIFSSVFSVDTNWIVTPDSSSMFTLVTGGIYLFSSFGSNAFISLQYYDILHDQWQTKTTPRSLIGAALTQDATIERTGKFGTAFLSGTATGGAARTLTSSGLTLTPNRFRNYRILITGGTGVGQNRRILCHTAATFTAAKPWDIVPDATSTFEVWGDYDKIYMLGNGNATMLAYSPENDYWMQGLPFDDGVAAAISARYKDWVPFGVGTGIRLVAGVTAINPVPTVAGSNYVVGDLLTCSVGGTGAQVIVTSVGAGGAVTGLALANAGLATGFTVGTGKATTGGTGTLCTIEITAVGAVCKVTLASNHFLRTGDPITIAGCSEAAYNTTSNILCVTGLATFDIATTATASMMASTSQNTTVIVDASKNWTVNEHAGKLVHLCVAGTEPTSQVRWIVSNTATTLTVATITNAVNGTSKYVIYDSKAFGVDIQYKQPERARDGFATGGSTTTLVDSTKNWMNNQWAGYRMRVEAGTGFGSGIISIISNTATTLTYATQSFTPDATTFYEIADSWGLATAGSTTSVTEATTKNWIVNQWGGKRVRITGGTNLGQEATVQSNTATALTTGTITAPDATSTYCIYGIPARGAGIQALWLWGLSVPEIRGKFILVPRGGASNTADIYDITTGTWTYGYHFSPQQETFTTGSMYAYDGHNTIYFHKDATGRIFSFNFVTEVQRGALQLTDLHGAALIGNRMEIIETEDGLDFLYLMGHSTTKMYRALLF
jgi:hypothetical protein